MHQEKNVVTATIKIEPIILFQRKTSPGKLCEVFWAVPVIQTALVWMVPWARLNPSRCGEFSVDYNSNKTNTFQRHVQRNKNIYLTVLAS